MVASILHCRPFPTLFILTRTSVDWQHLLVKWNPPNPDMRKPAPAPEEPFPWEYVNLDDIIVDLKLRPETLEVSVPRYFKVRPCGRKKDIVVLEACALRGIAARRDWSDYAWTTDRMITWPRSERGTSR